MLEKQHHDTGTAKVTFRIAAEVTADRAHVVGDFNDWSMIANAMVRDEKGFATTIALEVGRAYRFRYLLDGVRWENDWAADAYVPNEFGGDDSVVDLTLGVEPPAVNGPAPASPRRTRRRASSPSGT